MLQEFPWQRSVFFRMFGTDTSLLGSAPAASLSSTPASSGAAHKLAAAAAASKPPGGEFPSVAALLAKYPFLPTAGFFTLEPGHAMSKHRGPCVAAPCVSLSGLGSNAELSFSNVVVVFFFVTFETAHAPQGLSPSAANPSSPPLPSSHRVP